MTSGTEMISPDYGQWVAELKNRCRSAQIKASVAVNRELLRFYWDLGRDAGYGTAFFDRLSAEAKNFPQPVEELACVPWRRYVCAINRPARSARKFFQPLGKNFQKIEKLLTPVHEKGTAA